MSQSLIRHPQGFPPGYTSITEIGESREDTGMAFGVLVLGPGEEHRLAAGRERAVLLLRGEAELGWEGERRRVSRSSLFDEAPTALHVGRGTAVSISAVSGCELVLLEAESDGELEARLFDGESMAENEHRGKGLLDDTAYRIVRTIFDGRNRPEATLVLGEVVSFPGKWSSYPPHHHPQPEIYHYRFTEPTGYGHGELGDEVFKVRQHDTLKILDSKDHSQVAAPGYGMYYVWAIRHLPGRPYTTPEFTEEHRWLLDPGDRPWRPKEGSQ